MTHIGKTQLAYNRAGFRERYAMTHGRREVRRNGNHIWWVFSYSPDDEFQDANGATYDVTEGRWIN